jgi:outer membrane protein assembly factor BamB
MFSSGRRWTRRRGLVLGGALLAVIALGAVAAVLVLSSEPGDVSNPDVEFSQEDLPVEAPAPGEPKRGAHPMDDGLAWPNYHLARARTGVLAARSELRPPFVEQWKVTGRILLEFPPVSCRRSLYLLKNNAALYRVSRLNGRVHWKRKLGYLAAASPSCGGRTVYAVVLERTKGSDEGRVIALDTSTGRTRWSRKLPSRAESSPLLSSGHLYFGTEDGTIYALRASDGAVRWRAKASGAVKGGLALAGGRLFVGDYGGKLRALRQADGRKLWESSSAGGSLGRVGRFYGTPAVAYGRVYIGSLDGFVYSFSARDGRLAWRHKTGGYVYSSPALSTVRGVGPTVFAGSFDGKLYAFDAESGRVRWARKAGGRISGGPVVVGDLVFYSNLARKATAAVGAATGKLVWSVGRGAFNPIISDGRRIYLNGYSSLFMLSSPAQARRDQRARVRLGRANARQRAIDRRVGRRRRLAQQRAKGQNRARSRRVARRVAARRARVRRNVRARRQGREVCFRRDGRRVCRIPRPLVCVERSGDGRIVCRPRRR